MKGLEQFPKFFLAHALLKFIVGLFVDLIELFGIKSAVKFFNRLLGQLTALHHRRAGDREKKKNPANYKKISFIHLFSF